MARMFAEEYLTGHYRQLREDERKAFEQLTVVMLAFAAQVQRAALVVPQGPPLDLAVKVAEQFEKDASESLDCARRIEKRLVGGYAFDSDRGTAAHYRTNAEHYGSRGKAIRALVAENERLRAALVGERPQQEKQ